MDPTRQDLHYGRAALICPICGEQMTINYMKPMSLAHCTCGIFFELPDRKYFPLAVRNTE